MDWIVVKGDHGGRYPFDLETRPLTSREWGYVHDLAGYFPTTVPDGFGDPKLITVFAAIALKRAGRADDVPAVFDLLLDLPFGDAITLETDVAEETDAGPPAPSSSGSSGSSGAGSSRSSETPEPPRTRTGVPASATSVSVPVRSAT